jgi:uncharacterized Zn-binding protein involved in type VI secretion
MGRPAAKRNDRVTATDAHLIQTTAPVPPAPVPHAFSGVLDANLSPDVKIMGEPAATVGSTATNTPLHTPSGGTFVNPPKNQARVIQGSPSVRINGKLAARDGDRALTCNDPVDLPVGTVVVASSSVFIGD